MLLFALGSTACATSPAPPEPARQSVTYAADLSDFPNPERGFSAASGTAATARAANLSLMHVYFRLDDYKGADLPASYLAKVAATFADARRNGVKVVPRFIYNFPKGLPLKPGDEDAPLPRVLRHLDQLEPVLRENSDVIAFFEAGFVGAWGEWHHSTSGLDETPAKKAILFRLLDILPPSRAVALRYQRDKKAIFNRTRPITPQEAFSGSAVSRVGHHNDCFLASADDWDTYRRTEDDTLEEQKAYLAAENLYVPQGGETCNTAADAQPFIQCGNAVRELARLRWSQLNRDYHTGVLDLWKSQGCYDEIARRVGYRFRLLGSSFPTQLKPTDILEGTISITNDGFANPYNSRSVELVLRNIKTGDEHSIPLPNDPRRWIPGETQILLISAPLPASVRPGSYKLFLNLPDPEPSLRGRPEYSVRLANQGTWEPETGYNRLKVKVSVSR